MTDVDQPSLPDMPDVPDSPDIITLLSKVVEGEADEDIAAITAGALLGLRADVQSLADVIQNFINVVVVRNTELSERINVLGARHDQMYGRVMERIDGLKEAVQFVGEQQQYVTDETNRAKAELKEMAGKFMSNPMKAVGAFMGGGFMGGGRKRGKDVQQIDVESVDPNAEIEGVQNDRA